RCAECNLVLSTIEKEKAKGSIPEYVYMTQETFSICPGCHRIYWSAMHKEAIITVLEEVVAD
ncbi:MAG: Mut7-C RNAse domain-containing protein, partial [Deltaproteobacteria bacterium]